MKDLEAIFRAHHNFIKNPNTYHIYRQTIADFDASGKGPFDMTYFNWIKDTYRVFVDSGMELDDFIELYKTYDVELHPIKDIIRWVKLSKIINKNLYSHYIFL